MLQDKENAPGDSSAARGSAPLRACGEADSALVRRTALMLAVAPMSQSYPTSKSRPRSWRCSLITSYRPAGSLSEPRGDAQDHLLAGNGSSEPPEGRGPRIRLQRFVEC